MADRFYCVPTQSRYSTHAVLPYRSAMSRGFSLCRVRRRWSAPEDASTRRHPNLPQAAPWWRAEYPVVGGWQCIDILQPFPYYAGGRAEWCSLASWTLCSMQKVWLARLDSLAIYLPELLAEFTSAPFSTNTLAISSLPSKAARLRGVLPCLSRPFKPHSPSSKFCRSCSLSADSTRSKRLTIVSPSPW